LSDDTNTDEPGVHRLVDMEVHEVSLVDRAANQRRFLLIKRRDPMADDSETETETETVDPAGGTDDTDPDDVDDTGSDRDDGERGGGSAGASATAGAAKAPPAAAAAASPVAAAAVDPAAITALGEGVVKIGDAVAVIADSMGAFGERLDTLEKAFGAASGAGKKPKKAPPPDDDDDEADEDDDEDEAPAPPRKTRRSSSDAAKRLVGEARTSLARVPGVVQKTEKRDAVADGIAALTQEVRGLRTDLGELKTGVADGKQRLARLEKSHGLPSSQPVDGQRSSRGEDDDVSWPMNLNQPVDRESVDKKVSFHL
jgi:hypothetical protein